MRRIRTLTTFVAIACAGFAYAAVTFDPATGDGFAGKGDVQLACGMNNAQLQQSAPNVQIRVSSRLVTEVSWICTNSNNQNVQERERTTTTTLSGVFETVTRERNQVTGFVLDGYDGDPVSSSTTEGNPLNSCPSGPWSLTTPAGDPELVLDSTSIEAFCPTGTFANQWRPIQQLQ